MYSNCSGCMSKNNPGAEYNRRRIKSDSLNTDEPVTKEEIRSALPVVLKKLERIIEREGDANGERLKPEYLYQLILEQIGANRASCFTLSRYNDKKATDTQIPSCCNLLYCK